MTHISIGFAGGEIHTKNIFSNALNSLKLNVYRFSFLKIPKYFRTRNPQSLYSWGSEGV